MNILGNYTDLARSLGGWSERVEDPNQIVPALKRARKVTDNVKAALLDFITSREINYSRMSIGGHIGGQVFTLDNQHFLT
jgi:acetolactate synthase-1/2/3 large subunit